MEACRRELIQLALDRSIRRDILLGWRTRFDAVPRGTPGLTFNIGNGEVILDLDENELPRSAPPPNAPMQQNAVADHPPQHEPPNAVVEVAPSSQGEKQEAPRANNPT